MSLPALTLVLGGARSGKSRHAERLVLDSRLAPVYVATAEALDDEMAARIHAHRSRRDRRFRTVEAPLALIETLRLECTEERAVLVDCLTLWLTNLMTDERPVDVEIDRLVATLADLAGPLVLVSNEVGQGVVPASPVARAFVDHAGRLHQALAARADAVTLMVAGLPHHLKSPAA